MNKPEAGIVIFVIACLLFLNFYLFFSPKWSVSCYGSGCFYARHDFEEEFKAVVANHSRVLIIAEGDQGEKTQTTALVDLAFAQLAADFSRKGKQVSIIGIGLNDSVPVTCYECVNLSQGSNVSNHSLCPVREVSYCLSLEENPPHDYFVIVLKYPGSLKTKAVLEGNKLVVEAVSGKHLVGMVNVLHEWLK